MEFLNQILHFDSSMWILQALDNHWLLVNLIWGSFYDLCQTVRCHMG